jgi:mannose-1-phosphate guanylyltransferase
MIRRIIGWLAANGVSRLVLNLHHLPETLTAVVGDGGDLGVRVRYSWEQPRVLGSAGGPRQALPLLDGDAFLIVNGDTLTDLRLGDLADAHTASGALVTLALVPNREYERYGGVVLDGEQRVTGFVRRGASARGSFHFIGVQIANRSVFEPLPRGEPINSIGDVYDALIAQGRGVVRGVVTDAEFWDVGTVDDYWRTSNAFAEKEGRGDVSTGRAGSIHPTARIVRSILWDDVEVGANAVIEDCIVTDGAHVPAGAVYKRTIIHAGPENG